MKKFYLNWALIMLLTTFVICFVGFIVGMTVNPFRVTGAEASSMWALWTQLFLQSGASFVMLPAIFPLGFSAYFFIKCRKTQE